MTSARVLPKNLFFKKRPLPSILPVTLPSPSTPNLTTWAAPLPPTWGAAIVGESAPPGWDASPFVGANPHAAWGTSTRAVWNLPDTCHPTEDVVTTKANNATTTDGPSNGKEKENLMDELLKYENEYVGQKLGTERASKQVLNEQSKRRMDFMRNDKLSSKQLVFLWRTFGEPPKWERRQVFGQERVDSYRNALHCERIFNEFTNVIEVVSGLFDGYPIPDPFTNMSRKVYKTGYDYHDKYFRPYLQHPEWRAANAAADEPSLQTPPRPNSPPPHLRSPSPFGSSGSSGSISPPIHPPHMCSTENTPFDNNYLLRPRTTSSPRRFQSYAPPPLRSKHRPRSRSPYRRGASSSTQLSLQRGQPSRRGAQRNSRPHSRSRSPSPRSNRHIERRTHSPSSNLRIHSRLEIKYTCM